jgi:hypothetical protein
MSESAFSSVAYALFAGASTGNRYVGYPTNKSFGYLASQTQRNG